MLPKLRIFPFVSTCEEWNKETNTQTDRAIYRFKPRVLGCLDPWGRREGYDIYQITEQNYNNKKTEQILKIMIFFLKDL